MNVRDHLKNIIEKNIIFYKAKIDIKEVVHIEVNNLNVDNRKSIQFKERKIQTRIKLIKKKIKKYWRQLYYLR